MFHVIDGTKIGMIEVLMMLHMISPSQPESPAPVPVVSPCASMACLNNLLAFGSTKLRQQGQQKDLGECAIFAYRPFRLAGHVPYRPLMHDISCPCG